MTKQRTAMAGGPTSGDIHRGMIVDLPDEHVHGASHEQIAHHLVNQQYYLGMHWSDDHEEAEKWAHHPDADPVAPGHTRFHVVVHARHPGAEHEFQGTHSPRNGNGVFGYGYEYETPLNPGAPVGVHGVSWLDTRHPDYEHRAPHDKDFHPAEAWAHHTFQNTLEKQAVVLDDWQPSERIFAPTKKTLDPRLFDPLSKQMLPQVRDALLAKMDAFMGLHGTPNWRSWARVYLAGSEASLWWGNNDFDTLVGIEYDRFRSDTGSDMEDGAISDSFNAAFKVDWNDEQWVAPWGDVWHLTGYVNPASWDIRVIKPYAAYEVVSGTWFVEPPVEDQGHQFSDSEMYLFEGYAEEIRSVNELPEPHRTHRLQALWRFLHSDRSRAFGPKGTGVFDRGNAVEKYLDQAGLWDVLVQAQYGSAS